MKYYWIYEPDVLDDDFGEYVIYDPEGHALARVIEQMGAESLVKHLNRE